MMLASVSRSRGGDGVNQDPIGVSEAAAVDVKDRETVERVDHGRLVGWIGGPPGGKTSSNNASASRNRPSTVSATPKLPMAEIVSTWSGPNRARTGNDVAKRFGRLFPALEIR